MNELELHGNVPAIRVDDLTQKHMGRKAYVQGETFRVAGRIQRIEFGGLLATKVKVSLDLGDVGSIYLHLEPHEEVFVSI